MRDAEPAQTHPDGGSPHATPAQRVAEPAPEPMTPTGHDEEAISKAERPGRLSNGGRPSRDEAQSALREVDSAEEAGSAADAAGLEWCAIVYKRLGRQAAEFHVDVTEKGGSRRYIASSPAFRPPMFGAVRRRGKAKAAHELLVSQLETSGWRPVDAGGAWHELGFIRSNVVGTSDEKEGAGAQGVKAPSPGLADGAPELPQRRSVPEEPGMEPVGSQPDVPALLEQGDVQGLVQAASFQDPEHDGEGRPVDGGMRIREQAILALGEVGFDAGSKAVAAALSDSSDGVRRAAVQVLHSRGEVGLLAKGLGSLSSTGEKSRDLVFQAILENRSTRVARAAARALVRAPGNAPLSDADVTFVRSLAGSEEGREPTKTIVSELVKALSHDDSVVSERAEELLVGLASTSVPGLIAELKNDRSPDRVAIVLGRIGDSSAMEPLIGALEHSHEEVRLQAAAALGALRDPAAVEPLLRATRDSNYDVRAEASHALDHMGAAGVIVGMSTLLRSMVVEAVASALELPPPDGARRMVPQISAPAEQWQFHELREATRLPDDSP